LIGGLPNTVVSLPITEFLKGMIGSILVVIGGLPIRKEAQVSGF
jgi:hypothetical protein